jgi:flagella basal body P-ring formation protein FlgA
MPLILIFFLLLLPLQTSAQPDLQQSHAEIHEAVTNFMREQTLTLPGTVTLKVNEVDTRVVRPVCPTLETFLPPGTQLIGNSQVGVRCPGKKGWTLFVPVQVTVSADILITNKPFSQGHVLQADDISHQKSELTQTGMLTDPSQAIGKVLVTGVGTGQVIKREMLRDPWVVMQGQTVKLQVDGTGFSIRSEGQALHNAAEGQAVQVKTASGQIVSGIARQGGLVAIRP